MKPTDLTIEILKEIRDEVRGTNTRLDDTNMRLDETNTRLDATAAKLSQRIDETNAHLVRVETRIATELIAVASAVAEVRDELRADRALRARVEGLEVRVTVLEKKSA